MHRVALLLVAPLALVACGGGSSSTHADPVAYVRHSASRTASTPSEHMTMTGKLSAAGVDLSMSGSGDFSNARHLGSFELALSVAGHNVKLAEILDGTTVYASSPLFARKLPSGKKWLKLDLKQLGKSQGLDYSTLTTQNPTQVLQQLEAAGTVTQVGSDTIDGASTTHFRVEHLDITKLPQGAKIEALAHPVYGPIDVWIGNANGYVYRETVSFSYSVRGQSGTMTMSVDLSHFGEAIHVTVPPASQTLDGTKNVIQGSGG